MNFQFCSASYSAKTVQREKSAAKDVVRTQFAKAENGFKLIASLPNTCTTMWNNNAHRRYS